MGYYSEFRVWITRKSLSASWSWLLILSHTVWLMKDPHPLERDCQTCWSSGNSNVVIALLDLTWVVKFIILAVLVTRKFKSILTMIGWSANLINEKNMFYFNLEYYFPDNNNYSFISSYNIYAVLENRVNSPS